MRRSLLTHALPFQNRRYKKQSAYRPSWLSPGLTSHQLLDAGVAARQSASRKNIKKAQRPFENYFRSEFRCSYATAAAVGRNGRLSAYAAVRLMTDPKAFWGTPWGRQNGRGLTRTRHKRQDALERPDSNFGEDEFDTVIARLLELRFAWDREDEVFVAHWIPRSMFCLCEHSLPYADIDQHSYSRVHGAPDSHCTSGQEEEILTIDGTPIILRSPTGSLRRPGSKYINKIDSNKVEASETKWSHTGVNAIPSFIADIIRGPFLSSPHNTELTLRWKAANRRSESVSEVLQLHQRISAALVVGLPPRSALLLLFAIATVEIETPALEVSIGIAMGENYHGYERTECLEMLRCLRRLAFVHGLPTITPPRSFPLPSSYPEDALHRVPYLYGDASLTEGLFGRFIADTAPFLATKVWARLPEHSERLLRRRLYLDWIDLLYLSVEVNGNRLPRRLPNPASAAAYASKYLFLHYTLQIDEPTMANLVSSMRDGSQPHHVHLSSESSKTNGEDIYSETVKGMSPTATVEADSLLRASATCDGGNSEERLFRRLGEDDEKSLILWMSASFLVRLVSEALGDVLNHVGTYLQQCALLLTGEALREAAGPASSRVSLPSKALPVESGTGSNSPVVAHQRMIRGFGIISDHLEAYLDRLMLYRPRVSGEATHLLGRRRLKRVRVRLLPYESFPELAHSLPPPFRKVMQQAGLADRSQRPQHRSFEPQPQPSTHQEPHTSNVRNDAQRAPSTLASHIAQSSLASSHVERASDALRWSTMVLHHCLGMVDGLPPLGLNPPASCSASERRRAHCKRFAQSKIQFLMDELFFDIPWEEMEANIEPLLACKREGGSSDPSIDQVPSFLTVFSNENSGEDFQKEFQEETDEQRGQVLLNDLQMRVDEFQLSVADLLEAYEGFFRQEKECGGVTSVHKICSEEGGRVHPDTRRHLETQIP